MKTRTLVLSLAAPLLVTGAMAQRNDRIKAALGDGAVPDTWIYDDIEKGYAEAKRTGKPLLVAFR